MMAANSGNNQTDDAVKRATKKGTQKYIVPPADGVDIEAELAKLQIPTLKELMKRQLPRKSQQGD
jgi:hypothetical protein